MDVGTCVDDDSILCTDGGRLIDEPRVGGGGGPVGRDTDTDVIDTAEGEVSGVFDCDGVRIDAGRRVGGGGGRRPLLLLGRVVSVIIGVLGMLELGKSSSTFGDRRPELLRFSLESDTI